MKPQAAPHFRTGATPITSLLETRDVESVGNTLPSERWCNGESRVVIRLLPSDRRIGPHLTPKSRALAEGRLSFSA